MIAFSSGAFLSELYLKKQLSAAEIANKLKISKTTILKKLKEFNITTRAPHLPHGRLSQTKYGMKLQKGTLKPLKKEMRVIALIKKLHAKKLSYRNICEILINMGISTKNKSRKWHPEMIRRIIDRRKT